MSRINEWECGVYKGWAITTPYSNQIGRNMASFAKHLSLLLLIVLLSNSVGRSYGRHSFYFSKVVPKSVDGENDVADLFDHNEPVTEPAFSQLSKQEDDSNDDDEKLTTSLKAYEQGIKNAELVKNKMNGYGVKAINTNGFNDDRDYSLNDASTAYARGVKIAKSVMSKDIKDDEDADDDDDDDVDVDSIMDNDTEDDAADDEDDDVDVDSIMDNDTEDDDDDDEKLTKCLRAYGQGIKYAELVKNKMNSYDVKAADNYDNNDDGDNSLNSALTAYARGVEIAKSIKNNDADDDVDVNDIINSEEETYQQRVKPYKQRINQAKPVKNEDAEDAIEDDVNDSLDIKDSKSKEAYEQGVKYAKYLNDDEDMP